MRYAFALAGVVLAAATSCSRPNPKMQPDPGEGYVLETTGASIGRDDPRRNVADPTLGEVATRLAREICEREARCQGRAAVSQECMRATVGLTALEVVSWPCSPAATRARAEQCTAALNAEPCEMDMSTKPQLCAPSEACPDANAKLMSPGAELAKPDQARPSFLPSFNREAAGAALAAVDLTPCQDAAGPPGAAHITVTFAPDGAVLTSELDRGPEGSLVDLDGTPRGQCIIEQFRSARVPTFYGDPEKVGVSIPMRQRGR